MLNVKEYYIATENNFGAIVPVSVLMTRDNAERMANAARKKLESMDSEVKVMVMRRGSL